MSNSMYFKTEISPLVSLFFHSCPPEEVDRLFKKHGKNGQGFISTMMERDLTPFKRVISHVFKKWSPPQLQSLFDEDDYLGHAAVCLLDNAKNKIDPNAEVGQVITYICMWMEQAVRRAIKKDITAQGNRVYGKDPALSSNWKKRNGDNASEIESEAEETKDDEDIVEFDILSKKKIKAFKRSNDDSIAGGEISMDENIEEENIPVVEKKHPYYVARVNLSQSNNNNDDSNINTSIDRLISANVASAMKKKGKKEKDKQVFRSKPWIKINKDRDIDIHMD
ncbi:MAG: hypothetical protein DDT19_00659 [Syntrophomonadaceae bacterium]|nr:hypothetical protein [Bacillota bacterium]